MRLKEFFENRRGLKKYLKLQKVLRTLSEYPEDERAQVALAKEEYINQQTNAILANTPAEVLKKYKTGTRIHPVAHMNVLEVSRHSMFELFKINGVGLDTAEQILHLCKRYTAEVRKSITVRISPDDKTGMSDLLLHSLYEYDSMRKISQHASDLHNEVFGENANGLKAAKALTCPLRYLFTRDKAHAKECFDRIMNRSSAEFTELIDSFTNEAIETKRAEHNEYWNAFISDPSRYYALLDEIIEDENRQQESGGNDQEGQNNRIIALTGDTRFDILPQQLLNEITSIELKLDGLRCILRPYQRLGVQYILNQKNVLLGDEMGLGKTVEAIATMVCLRNMGEGNHFIVVCPASVLINWKREVDRHSDLESYILHGNDFSCNLVKWRTSGGVAITNYENVGRLVFQENACLSVIDEAHYVKNPQAARTQNTIRILEQSTRRLFMTGTPLENKLVEMMKLITLLQPDVVSKVEKLITPIRPEEFREAVIPVYFRRTKDYVWKEMPELERVDTYVDLSAEEEQLYADYYRQKTGRAFVCMRQISFLIDNLEKSSKLSRIKEICAEAYENKRKVIIFSSYLKTIDAVLKCGLQNVFGPITGAISPEQRQNIIDSFSESADGGVLVSQILAGGTGLNIQKASIVIICEPQFKPSIENQAIARAYRMGQLNNVTVYRLLARKSVDERLEMALKKKQEIFDKYADKSITGEESIAVTENELMDEVFSGHEAV